MSYAKDALQAELEARERIAQAMSVPGPSFKDGPPEVRVTSETGGQKGQKSDRQDLIDSTFLQELGLVCGFGASKYDDDNWRKGYSWRLSFGAMLRHIHAWWRGEETDPESGLSHLAHAAWHCMVLFTFARERDRYGVHDDRPR